MINLRNVCLTVLAFGALSAGCTVDGGETVENGKAPENVAKQEDDLYVLTSTKWLSNEIPVCWDDAGFATEKSWVREAIRNTWEIESTVTFTGWGACASSTAAGIHVVFQDALGASLTGTQLDGVAGGLKINTWVSSPSCGQGWTRERCVRATAVHEFGHGLGFKHEHKRSDKPASCTETGGSVGNLMIGPWDSNSVMNYCNPVRNGDGRLSAGDIRGVIQVYGDNTPLTVASVGDPTNNVYFRGAGPASDLLDLYETYTSNSTLSTWSAPADFGGTFASSPHAVSWGPGRLDVFAVGTGYDVWQRSFASSSWSNWVPLGGFIKGKVKAVARTTNRLDIFARGGDDALWTRSWNGSAWSAWASLGADFVGEPSAVAMDANHLDVFVRDRAGNLQHRAWNGTWGAWQNLGNGLASSPSAVASGPSRIDVAIRDIDDHVWTATLNAGVLSWTFLPGASIRSTPKLISRGTDRVDIFARGTDNNMWLNGISITGQWVGWGTMAGGPFKGSPEANSNGGSRIDLFAASTSGALKRRPYNNGSWFGWSTIAGSGSIR